GHRPEQLGRFAPEVWKYAAEELAQDERVDQGGPVLGLDGPGGGLVGAVAAVGGRGEVDLVSPAAVVVGPAGTDREPEGHRLQRPRLVPRQLQPLHVRGEARGVAADGRGRPPGAVGEEAAEAIAAGDAVEQ